VAVKAILDSLDGIEDGLKEHYAEKDGKFVLDVEDFGRHPGAATLKATLDRLDKANKASGAKLAEAERRLAEIPEGFDPEEYLRLKADADPDKKKALDEHLQSQRQLYEQRISGLQKKHEEDVSALKAEVADRDSYIDKSEKFSALHKSLGEAGVDPDFLPAVVDHLSPLVKVQRAENGDRRAIVETDLGEVDVASFVRDWTASKGKKFLGKPTGPDPKGNNSSRSGAKTISRTAFMALTPAEQSAKIKDGHTVVDA
jgi:hypothetical protein